MTNKHLLPVGRWPMVYYPLQLLQRAGVTEVLLVTGQQHAGDFIDLLGDGRVRARATDEPLFELDLTYKVQVEPGGIAQVVGMARDFARGDRLDRLSRRQHLRARARGRDSRLGGGWRRRARVRQGRARPGELRRGRVRRRRTRRRRRREGRASSTCATTEPPSSDAVVGLYCYPPDVFDIIDGLEPSSRGELEITDVNRVYAQQGRLAVERVEGWWHDGGKHWADLADVGRLIDETGANK